MKYRKNNIIKVKDLYKDLPINKNKLYYYDESFDNLRDINQFERVILNEKTIVVIEFEEQIKPNVYCFNLIKSKIERLEVNIDSLEFNHINDMTGYEINLKFEFLDELQNYYFKILKKELPVNFEKLKNILDT